MFPGANISAADDESPTFIHQLKKLYKQGVTHATMVAGSDRVDEYKKLLNDRTKIVAVTQVSNALGTVVPVKVLGLTAGNSTQGHRFEAKVATVVLDAPANRVYQVATNATNRNQQVTVVSNDPATMTINLKEGDQSATLNVTALNKNLSQLMIVGTAPVGENPQTTRIVNAAMRLCGDLGKHCQVGSN